MTSNKPYLIRAMYEWISDNGWTPYIVLNTQIFGCMAPQENMQKEQVVFNIAMPVVKDLVLGNDAIEFKARFSGVIRSIYAPISAVVAIYAKENNQGMSFHPEAPSDGETDGGESGQQSKKKKPGKPHLQIVK